MKATSVASVGIVPEVLTSDNYERWSVFMTNYLMGKGLWDFVGEASSLEENFEAGKHLCNKKGKELESTPDIEQGLGDAYQSVSKVEREVSWKKKNAKALHIIQISCGKRIQDELLHFKTASEAWNHLANIHGRTQKGKLYPLKDTDLDDSLGEHHKHIFRRVERGVYIGNIDTDSDIYIKSASGRTLLHVAVVAGNVENVEMLVKNGKDNLVNMQDNHGDTALALVARCTGNIDMAKCMVERENGSHERLLEMHNSKKEIPILIAAANGHKELTTYLYLKTPSRVFDGSNSRNRLLLFERCITAEIFDVALRLLLRYGGDLLIEASPRDLDESNNVLVALAKTPSIFPSDSRFGLREQLIYDNLSVEKEFADNYAISYMANFARRPTRYGLHETSTSRKCCWSVCRFCRLVLNILLLPLRLLGRLLAYLLVQIFWYLDMFGTRRIYRTKYAHYEVLAILSIVCRRIAQFNDLELRQVSAYEAILYAAQNGIIEFINSMRDANPNLLLAVDAFNRGIFSYAIMYRKQNVFQLMLGLEVRKETFSIDTFGNNILHLAAQLGPSSGRNSRYGAALQMQREIQWFKAVEKIVHPTMKENKNGDGKKPYDLFTENHEELLKAGEKLTKETATSYIGVVYIIITIMFAAVFTIPGGNNQDTGSPIFLHDNMFNIFLLADALSIIASASSLLVFIGIHTSSYTAKDFLKVLPIKLMVGLMLLIFSICSMLVAFYAALNMILKGNHTSSRWSVLGPIVSLGSVPITILIVSRLRFIYKIFHSTIKNPISSI